MFQGAAQNARGACLAQAYARLEKEPYIELNVVKVLAFLQDPGLASHGKTTH